MRVLTEPDDPQVDRWRHDITVIAADVATLYHARSIYRVVSKFVADNDELPPSVFYGYLLSTYAITQSIAIRRQLGRQRRDSVTLERLLDEIKRDPTRLTRERFVALFPADDVAAQAAADATWNLRYASSVGSSVDPAVVELDRKALVTAAASVKTYADERIAHSGRERLKERPAFGDIDKAIDVIGPLYDKYAVLLHGFATIRERSTRADLVKLFSVPWVRR